jgi:hypothetical protein
MAEAVSIEPTGPICPITADVVRIPYTAQCCGTVFELLPILKWLESHDKCPYCRQKFNVPASIESYARRLNIPADVVDQVIQLEATRQAEEARARQAEEARQRQAEEARQRQAKEEKRRRDEILVRQSYVRRIEQDRDRYREIDARDRDTIRELLRYIEVIPSNPSTVDDDIRDLDRINEVIILHNRQRGKEETEYPAKMPIGTDADMQELANYNMRVRHRRNTQDRIEEAERIVNSLSRWSKRYRSNYSAYWHAYRLDPTHEKLIRYVLYHLNRTREETDLIGPDQWPDRLPSKPNGVSIGISHTGKVYFMSWENDRCILQRVYDRDPQSIHPTNVYYPSYDQTLKGWQQRRDM